LAIESTLSEGKALAVSEMTLSNAEAEDARSRVGYLQKGSDG